MDSSLARDRERYVALMTRSVVLRLLWLDGRSL